MISKTNNILSEKGIKTDIFFFTFFWILDDEGEGVKMW